MRTAKMKKSFFDDFDEPNLEDAPKGNAAVGLTQILAKPKPAVDWILPGVIAKARNTLVRVGPNVDALLYANILGFACSAGVRLGPYGKATASKTLMLHRTRNETRIDEHFGLLHNNLTYEFERDLASDNLFRLNYQEAEDCQTHLNLRSGQDWLLNSLPSDCKLVIIFDVGQWLKNKCADASYYRHFSKLRASLNDKGIATLIFYGSQGKSANSMEEELATDNFDYFIDLTSDSGAQREIGGGFNVTRRRFSELDEVPLHYSVWHTIMDGELKFSWECKDPADNGSVKKLEVMERQRRVAQLAKSGIAQKEIASVLGLTTATVCRDVAAIKKPRVAEQGQDADDSDTF